MKIILVCLIIFISCQDTEYRKVRLEDVTTDSYIPLRIGQKLLLEMEGNPSTGYTWILTNHNELNKVRVTNLNEFNSGEYFSMENNGKRGVGGIFHFKFEAKEIGNDVLIFNYKRSWSEEDSIIKSVNVLVFNSDL